MFLTRLKAQLLGGASLMLALCCLSARADAANLLTNPDFEAAGGSYTGWFTFGSGLQLSTPATDNIFRSGSTAAKIYGQFSGCPGTPTFNVGGFGQAFTTITAGTEYEFSGFSFVSGADAIPGTDICSRNRLIAKVVFFNALTGGSEIQSNEVVIGSGQSLHDVWVPFSISSIAPSAARRVEILFLFLQPGCDTGSAFVDDVSFQAFAPQVTANSLTNPGFATGLTGWSTFGNVFAETRVFGLRTRAGSAKLFSTFVVDSPSGLYQSVPTTAGTQWEFSAWALNTCVENPVTAPNDNVMVAKLVFRDATNVEIGSNEVVLADKTSPLGTWIQRKVSGLAPIGTATVQPFILFVSPSLFGGNFFVDDLVLRRLDVLDVPGTPTAGLFEVRAISPNPASGPVRIDYALAQRGPARIAVYDVTGRWVQTLFEGEAEAGPHTAMWDGRGQGGRLAPAGVYRCIVHTASGQRSRAMVLTR